ncbi:MAG: D-alanyl-D-alanine carboxypeptidase, partial [Lachnospiraceae bacterium]|nr:D-alanyl-D-alanine carboxypeptidase [Lachnospiraceae bacterium]
MKKRILAILLLLLIVFEAVYGQCVRVSADDDAGIIWPTGPEITADGAIVVEATTGSILYEKNIYDKFFPASTTKILTTLVALENSELNEIVTVSYAADNYVSKTSSRMGLVEGEQITMEQALYGIMLESANEGTYAVGEHVGGSIARFIKMMNAKAKSLGCVNSNFANSHGLHDEDHYTCPYDLALIARAAYQ